MFWVRPWRTGKREMPKHRLRISRFPVRHGRTQNIHLGKYNIVRDFHYLLLEFGLENTVSKTMSLKRSSAAGLPSTFLPGIAPCQQPRKNSATPTGSNTQSLSP